MAETAIDRPPATPGEIWAILRENAELQRETNRRINEYFDRSRAEMQLRSEEEAKRREA